MIGSRREGRKSSLPMTLAAAGRRRKEIVAGLRDVGKRGKRGLPLLSDPRLFDLRFSATARIREGRRQKENERILW